jgi:hypothetical protein
MFSIIGGLLSTALIAVATYVISVQPVPVTPPVEHSAVVKVASHSADEPPVRE